MTPIRLWSTWFQNPLKILTQTILVAIRGYFVVAEVLRLAPFCFLLASQLILIGLSLLKCVIFVIFFTPPCSCVHFQITSFLKIDLNWKQMVASSGTNLFN